tara:strand:+ start:428 stop:817 length:390 start_codon:yes stop_codon:yes gene_type:complete
MSKTKKTQPKQTHTEEHIRNKVRRKIENIERDIFDDIKKDIRNEILAEYCFHFTSESSVFDTSDMRSKASMAARLCQEEAAKVMGMVEVDFNPGLFGCLKRDISDILDEEVKKIEDKVMGLVEAAKSDR